ncbi:methyl-accepting chemotaxis protein [Vibrio sp. 10N.261.46.E12]|uniref:methyl-accepting chemotaxis protein n=5 Tax=Vibrio TaxID=662 RepID=UPI0009761C6D|nr:MULTISPECIES: methyl-accepting chemotaxis protein [unclassified Vibrio]OMO32496.1 chemotaxis protein [Vibrio sp. 10N.261.45.E1]PMJ21367.1 chemotaxis protein [Vibrio sp. 10N.286.45.B6]PML84602.1 chemotaxis protein [Vibrio sp. 10N.261.49.E11]PMM64463.1 chemotaxis protein [Vibrio sp. 10N.261.46.F12]PMM78912.1 chemotaxis protein [Vibrio sp. 10N.261.46.E8]
MISLLFTTSHFADTTAQMNEAKQITKELEVRLLNLRRNEKDFLLRSDIKYLDKFDANYNKFLASESQLTTVLADLGLANSTHLREDIETYHTSFVELVNAYEVYGLARDKGMLGEFHALLDNISATASAEQKIELYLFNDLIEKGEFDPSVLSSDLLQLSANSNALLEAAKQVVEQKKVIGLDHKSGLLGDARSGSHIIETQFKEFSAVLDKETQQEMATLSLINNILCAILLASIILFSWLIVRSIIGKIESLLSVIRNIVDSNDVSIRSTNNGKDELGTLGEYFNQLLDQLEGLISASQAKSLQLNQSTSNMHDELESVIQQFEVQANHTSTMTTSVQEMVLTIGEISESTSVAAEGVHQAKVNADKGREVVVATIDNITQLSERLSSSQDSISSLNHHVDQIGDAVNIIQGIAEQTNLLALNAAIEAARAGEQGRGFAVVADEVRALASRTHQSTTEITSVVSAIQSQMQASMTEIGECNQQGQLTLKDSEELDASLQLILSDMESIQGNSERIASAIEEQGAVMAQVSDSITELNTISNDNNASAQHCLVEVDKVAEQASDMDKAVAQFKTS